jgi:Lar family restriction alleviation protein
MSTVIPFGSAATMALARADVTRPCPFCAALGEIHAHEDEYGSDYYATCPRCGAEGPKAENPSLAAAAWNHRAPR